MKALGLLVPHIVKNKDGEEEALDAEPRTIQTPFGDRGGVVIEPWLTDQWYVNAEELAKAPMAAVRIGRDRYCAQILGEDLLQLDGEYPALVCFAAVVVGASDSGLVWAQSKSSKTQSSTNHGCDARLATTLRFVADDIRKQAVIARNRILSAIGAMNSTHVLTLKMRDHRTA